MNYPKPLRKGDTIGLIAPSSAVSGERVDACIKKLEQMGFGVKAADNLSADYGGYMAGDGKIRGQWINRMFADPEVDAIFCIRGGDGGSRAFEHVDLELVRRNPKIFVGYSDVTTFHLAFNQSCDLVTFHGPMVSSNMVDSFDAETEAAFRAALTAKETYVFQNPAGMEIGVLKEGRASGRLVGGNLALLSASIGTPYELDTKDKILFLEEVGETPGRLERFAWHLRNSGKYRDCRGILLGQFTECENKAVPDYNVLRCFADILKPFDIPVLYNLQSGHGEKMITVPMGAICTMDTAERSIRFDYK
ncbi:MAG: LD-carboxypeptidase [Lachnospiraceae bacterium]|nr:LD-carboxypeptidase [Lachnospiraceae bacterium]